MAPVNPPATTVPSAIKIAFSAPSAVGRSSKASAGEVGELVGLGLEPDVGAPDSEGRLDDGGVASAVDGVVAAPPIGDEEVAHADMITANAIMHAIRRTTRRIVPMCRLASRLDQAAASEVRQDGARVECPCRARCGAS